jgi:hypothetical protein
MQLLAHEALERIGAIGLDLDVVQPEDVDRRQRTRAARPDQAVLEALALARTLGEDESLDTSRISTSSS